MRIPIMVTEDNGDIRKLIRLSLDAWRYALYEAFDGRHALSLAQTIHPRLILLDVMMPGGMDGLEVCRQIRADPALHDVRVLMLSARGQRQDMEAGLAAGADLYLVKPFSPIELATQVERLLADTQSQLLRSAT